jgi:hypothetical protein
MFRRNRVTARARRVTPPLAVLLLIGALIPSMVFAATVAELLKRAASDPWVMSCTSGAELATCTKSSRLGPWQMQVKPGSGPIVSVVTAVQKSPPLDATATAWMIDMHQFACGDPKGVDAFVSAVAQMTLTSKLREIKDTIGTCDFVGGLYGGATAAPVYRVTSTQLPPPPTPRPTPTATPNPSATPGPSATTGPTAKPSATPIGSARPTPSPSAAPSGSPRASASVAPTGSPAASADASPSAGPSPVVGGVQTGPPPTPDPTGPIALPAEATPTPTPAPTHPTFEQSVAGITDVNTDTGAIGGSLLLALLMLLIIGFAGELFNNTIENNYSIIAGWLKRGPLGVMRNAGGRLFGEARIGLVAFLLLTTLVSCFVDPYFGLDLRSLGEFFGMLAGLVIVLASFKLPPMLAHKRKTGELGQLRPLPWALVIAVVFVLVSRIGNLQPGYLYGIVLGAIFVKEVSPQDEGRETFYGSVWTLGAAAVGWLALTWLHGLGVDPNGFAITLLATACAAVTVAGLEATAFGLMPLRFMPGYAVYRWNRLGWALLWGLSLFGFLHILIAPSSGYVSELSPSAFAAALGVFAAFGALSILTWGYFRFRRPTPTLEIRFD